MKFSLLALMCLCIIGGILVIPAVKTVFLDKATEVILEGTNYAKTVLKAIM